MTELLAFLLDPKVWVSFAVALVIGSIGGELHGRHAQKHYDELEKEASIAQSNQEARHFEQKRQTGVDEAAKTAALRERKLRTDANNARAVSDGLRQSLDALQRASEKSLAASNAALATTSELLSTCSRRYSDVAEEADRADSEARELREAWPK